MIEVAPLLAGPADAGCVDDVRAWRASLAPSQYTHTTRIGLDDVEGWRTGGAQTSFTHESGRFFAVRGHQVRAEGGRVQWSQPMVHQLEVGLLAIALTPTSRGWAALVQAKAEPGNINGIQLSPTVQATRSNQERVHGGAAVPHLDLFDSATADVVIDSCQSEHGGVFWRKHNRAMLVQTAPFAPAKGFRWVEVADLLALLHVDNLVHADTRAVLACAPWTMTGQVSVLEDRLPSLRRSLDAVSTCNPRELLHWSTRLRAGGSFVTDDAALPALAGWRRRHDALARTDGTGFEVVAVEVRAAGREVSRWCQPMVRPTGTGVVGLAVCDHAGQVWVLLQVCREPGLDHGVELGPTVQVAGGDAPRSAAEAHLLTVLLERPTAAVLFDAELSDEGGRFLHSRSRHVVALVDPLDPAPGHRWCPLSEVLAVLGGGGRVTMQARSALICLLAAAVGAPRTSGPPAPRARHQGERGVGAEVLI